MELFYTSLLIENILLFKFLGVYLLLGFTRTGSEAAKAGILVAISMIVAGLLGWALDAYVLVPLEIGALRPWAFSVVVVLVALAMARLAHRGDGGFVRSGLLNTAVLGLLLVNAGMGHGAQEALVSSIGSAAGVLLVMVIIGSMMDAVEASYIPAPLRGAPIRLIAAGMLAMGVMGFRFPLR